MKKFYFSLDKVLSLRVFYEKQAEVALKKAVAERDEVLLRIEDIDSKVLETSALFAQDVDMGVLLWTETYVKGLKAKKLQLQTQLVKLEAKVKECLAKYHDALKSRKVLDRLKDKRIEEWKDECSKEEMFAIDEVVSAKISLES